MDETARFAWGPVILGSLVCLMGQIVFLLVGGGAGLAALDFETGQSIGTEAIVGGAIFIVVATVVSYFVGGFFASRAVAPAPAPTFYNGIAVWAFTSALTIFMLGQGLGLSLGTLLTRVGIGAEAAGTAELVVRELKNLRIVSDVKLTQGEIVTHLEVPDPTRAAQASGREAGKAIQKAARAPQVKEAVGDAREITAAASFSAFGVLLVGLFASLGGARLGSKPSPSSPSRRWSEEDRRAA